MPNNSYTPEGLCKENRQDYDWTIREKMPLGDGKATIYLLSGGYEACAVTLKQGEAVGNSTTLSVWVSGIDAVGEPDLEGDRGEFQYYAGPVYIWDQCVDWGGRYGGDKAEKSQCG